MNLDCEAMLVLLIGSRNGFADFGIGREVVVVADLQNLPGIDGRFSQELEPKHINNKT